jgi:hypothetical protein
MKYDLMVMISYHRQSHIIGLTPAITCCGESRISDKGGGGAGQVKVAYLSQFEYLFFKKTKCLKTVSGKGGPPSKNSSDFYHQALQTKFLNASFSVTVSLAVCSVHV